MYRKIISIMNSIFSTVGMTGLCIMLLTAVTNMDFVDIGVVGLVVGCYVGVVSFIGLRQNWNHPRRQDTFPEMPGYFYIVEYYGIKVVCSPYFPQIFKGRV